MIRLFGVSILALIASSGAATAQTAAPDPLFEVAETDPDAAGRSARQAFARAFDTGEGPTRTMEGKRYTFSPLALIDIDGELVALVSVGENADDCHPCSGVNAVHYLSEGEIVGEWFDIGATGTFGGAAGRWGVSRAIAASPVLYTEGGGTWQGYTCTWATFTELRPEGPREMVDGIPVGYSGDGTEINGAVTSASPGERFMVTYSGSRAFSETYVRDGASYRLASGETAMTTC